MLGLTTAEQVHTTLRSLAAVFVIHICKQLTITSDKGGGKCFRPRLSVCLSVSKITQKRVHGFGWNVACRQMSGHGRTDLLFSPIRIIVRMPEPDCFLRYRISAATRNFITSWEIPRIRIGRPSLQRGVVLKLFYSPRAVGTPLSEVHAIYRVPF